MHKLAKIENSIPSMSASEIEKVRRLEEKALAMPQVNIETSQILHAGTYIRTVMIPAGVMITGALIKIPTTLIISGEVTAFIGNQTIHIAGYNVIPAMSNRKQAFIAKTDTYLTMIFASNAASVEEAEMEFTDESDMLVTRRKPEVVECLA